MTALGAILAFAGVWVGLGAGGGHSLARLRPRDATGRSDGRSRPALVEDTPRRTLVCVITCAAVGWVFGGVVVAVAGVPAGALLSVWVGRMESPTAARTREEIEAGMPLAVDLLAACAAVGRPPESSLRVVAAAVGGALGQRLALVAGRLEFGADPVAEWKRLGDDPQFAPLARTMQRTVESGAPLVDGLTLLAEDRRRDRRMHTQMRARSVGVKAAGPLAACFLPAFMLVGVVPTIVGAFRAMLG